MNPSLEPGEAYRSGGANGEPYLAGDATAPASTNDVWEWHLSVNTIGVIFKFHRRVRKSHA